MALLIFFAGIAISQLGELHAQKNPTLRFTTLPESRLWIDGSSTINSFTCETARLQGSATIQGRSIAQITSDNGETNSRSSARVVIEVRSFDCGNAGMNTDMFNALKADQHPFIRFELLADRLVSWPEAVGAWFDMNVRGALTIAGVTDTVDIPIKIRQMEEGRVQIIGSKSLSMLDYDITPPSAFFGLIKAHEKLVIRFNLIAAVEQSVREEVSSPTSAK